MSLERFVPDPYCTPEYLQASLEENEKDIAAMNKAGVDPEKLRRRYRYLLAKWEIDEPPMRDQMQDVSHWARLRMIESSEDISAHRSDVSIVAEHPELGIIADREKLELEMRGILYASTFHTTVQGKRYELRYAQNVAEFETYSTAEWTVFTPAERQQFADVLTAYRGAGSPQLPKRNDEGRKLRDMIEMSVFLGPEERDTNGGISYR